MDTGTLRLGLFAAAAAGGALGSLLTLALSASPPPAPTALSPRWQAQIADIAASLEAMDQRLTRMQEQLAVLPPPAERLPVADTALHRAEPASPQPDAPPDRRSMAADATNWISVLDKDLAKVLVERGLTPFDPKVTSHVTAASNALRRLDDECRAVVAPALELFQKNQIQLDEFLRTSNPAEELRKEQRRAIITRLIATLDGAPGQPTKD